MRFKHGIHTIYLFVDSSAPFSNVTKELRELLRDRYPTGLTTSIAPLQKTIVSEDAQLVYGTLNSPNDPSRGWKKLKVSGNGSTTPIKAGIKNNGIVAFTIVEDADEDKVIFEVEWPKDDEEEEELYHAD